MRIRRDKSHPQYVLGYADGRADDNKYSKRLKKLVKELLTNKLKKDKL